MTCLLTDSENRNNDMESDLKSTVEKSLLLRDIIGNLEGQLEKKTSDEARVLDELAHIKEIVDEKEIKMSEMAKMLETLQDDINNRIANDILATSEKNSNSIAVELEMEKKVVEQMRTQLGILVDILEENTNALENLHEAVCSQSCSSPSEDVSIRNQKKQVSNFVLNHFFSNITLLTSYRFRLWMNRHLSFRKHPANYYCSYRCWKSRGSATPCTSI